MTPPTRKPPPEPSLKRELWAVLVLYGCLAILPLLLGWGCSGL